MTQQVNNTRSSTRINVETEFPVDTSTPQTIGNKSVVTGAFVEMTLSDKVDNDTGKKQETPSPNNSREQDSLSSCPSASRSTPSSNSRPPPPRIHYSLPRARNDPPKEIDSLINNQPPDSADYDDVYRRTTADNKNATSGKVIDKLQQIHQNSSGTADFLRNFRIYIKSCGAPWIWILIFGLLCLYPLAMIIVGSVNMKKCSIEPMIPVYLVVAGVFFIVLLSLKIYEELLDANMQAAVRQSLQTAIWWRLTSAIVTVFLFIWLVPGCFWVYRAHLQGVVWYHAHLDVDRGLENRCQKDLYMFAFWTVTLQIILLGVGLVGTFILITSLNITAEKHRNSSRSADEV